MVVKVLNVLDLKSSQIRIILPILLHNIASVSNTFYSFAKKKTLKIFFTNQELLNKYRSEFRILRSQSGLYETISRKFGIIPARISPELSRNDNISDFLKLGEIVDTFDIGSLSVRPIYTDGR